MSTSYSNPSPSKATTSTKRPYESTTPSNLGTPRDIGRSPGATKKVRPNGEEVKDVGKGGQWMIAKLDELQRMYKEVLLAATAVVQYQTYALKLGRQSRSLPVHLQRRVKIAWGNFEATRRHVQVYMSEAAADASTPSSKHLNIPVPLPPTTSLSIPHDALPSTAPIASPIPLSASTMLTFPEPSTGIIKSEPKPNDFEFNMLPTLPSNNGLGNLDLANMNMSDFAAMMANSGFDYSSIPTPTQGNNNIQPNPPSMSMPMPTDAIPRTREQSDTDRLLAQLGAFTGPDTSTSMNQAQLGAFTGSTNNNVMQSNTSTNQAQGSSTNLNTVNDDEVNALLASLNDGNVGGTDYSNFDFGDIDLGNLGDMSGLFNTTTIPEPNPPSSSQQPANLPPTSNMSNANANTNMPSTNTQVSNNPPAPTQVPSQPQPQVQQPPLQITQASQQQQPIPAPEPKQETTNTTIPTVPMPTAIPVVDPNLDLTNVFDESQAIDLDDFNFGNGDGGEDGGIDLTGDEFENLLAAFN